METVDFEEWLAPVDLAHVAQALAAWQWLDGIAALRPVAVSLAGDVFLIDATNAIYLLDTSFGRLERIASGNDAFRARLQDWAFTASLMRLNAVGDLLDAYGAPPPGNVFGYGVPLVFGGTPTPDNSRPVDVRVILAMLGQLHQGLRSVPVGGGVLIEFRGFPGQETEPPPGPRRPLIKRAPDRASFAVGATG